MTRVRAMRCGDHYAVHARGHATGSPQVCAAISGLLYALAGYARNAGYGLRERLDSGDVYMEFRGGAGMEAAYDMAVIGLMQIAAQYPEYLEIEAERKETQ
ncbi:MAG: hypothetical protein SO107_14830 [Flavonifractor plautii]|nr:hypothetical protein [Flavonifractor plautii]